MAANDSEIVPPSNVTVDFERRPVLYLPDGRVLVRQAGFCGVTMPGYHKGGSSAKTPRKGGKTKKY